jgi:hypothetical protein
VVQAALRDEVRHAERVVEVPVGEEQVGDPRQLAGAASGVEGQARRVDPEPGLLARRRASLDRQLAEGESGRGRRRMRRARGQISV